MLFVVDKPLLQQMIAIVRDDRTPATRGMSGLFSALKPQTAKLTLEWDAGER